jgi:hypothetical protein
VWDAVTPPPGDTIAYVVTQPGGAETTTSSSGWRSQATTITVSLGALGLLYLCSTP